MSLGNSFLCKLQEATDLEERETDRQIDIYRERESAQSLYKRLDEH